MMKNIALIALLISASTSHAQSVCLGFSPEFTVTCEEGGAVSKVHGFEERGCGSGRDGILNDKISIYKVEGPVWFGGNSGAQVTYTTALGDKVTLKNCMEIER